MENAELPHQKFIRALNTYESELDAMNLAVMDAAKNGTEIPNVKDIFKEMAEASRECEGALDYYGADKPIPPDVRQAMQGVLDELSNCAKAFVLYMATARLALDH
jgi:hypothetical protein